MSVIGTNVTMAITPLISVTSIITLFLMMLPAVAFCEPITNRPLYDQVETVTTTSLALVVKSPDEPWVVLHLMPDDTSGKMIVTTILPNGSHSAKDGRISVSGSYFVLEQLGLAVPHPAGSFYWELSPHRIFLGNGFVTEDQRLFMLNIPFFTRPDGSNQFLLCQLHEEQMGMKRFSHVHGVPDDWKADVAPAVACFRAHPSLLDTTTAETDNAHDALEHLTHDPNPYIVLTAYQLLSATKRFDTTDMDWVLSLNDTRLMAGVIASVSLDGWRKSVGNEQWFVERVKTISTLDQLEGIAYAVECAATLSSGKSLPYAPEFTYMALSHDDYDANDVLFAQVRARLNALYKQPFANDARARAIDEVCRANGQ